MKIGVAVAESHRPHRLLNARRIKAPANNWTSKPQPSTDFISPSAITIPPHGSIAGKMMLPTVRSRIAAFSSSVAPRIASRAAYSTTTPRFSENYMQPNDPTPQTPKPNVSETNATPVDSMGSWDAALKETPDVAERVRSLQAPNRKPTWAKSQRSREDAMSGPRFEQTIMELQVRYYPIHGGGRVPGGIARGR